MEAKDSLFDNCEDAIVIANHDYQITFCNLKARQIFADDLVILMAEPNHPSCHLFRVDDETETRITEFPLKAAVDGDRYGDREFLLRSLRSGEDLWLSITGFPVKLEEAPVQGGMVIIRDITQRKLRMLQKLQTVFRDKLTGLVNRSVFIDRVGHALTRTRRSADTLIAILCIDVRRLKAVNDTLGYAAGDQLLAELAQRLKTLLKPEDTLSRLGGDEFTVLLEDITSYSDAIAIAEMVSQAMAAPFTIAGQEIQVAVSIGIALGNATCKEPEMLLRKADLAMHQAKKNVDASYSVFEDSMQVAIDNSLHLEMALRKAIERQELFLEYQPIFQVTTQEIIGFESLIRWQHPERGVIHPAEFIPIAEKTGLIIPLGWWILEESCRQLKTWQTNIAGAVSLFVSVNMSSRQFAQKDVVHRIQTILSQVSLKPSSLRLEITESVLIDHSTSIVETLKAIQEMGIKLSIDDFGTGYSSLSYLYRFPFDTLKIDRSFLENADADFEKLEILQSVVHLAWNLGLEVVVEGVETAKHYAQVKALRCELGQGFLFSPPLKPQAMEALIRAAGGAV